MLGRAGSGKTRACLDAVLQRLEQSPHGTPLIILVPEQASFQMERALLTAGGVRATHRAHVLSFRRLAARMRLEMGRRPLPSLGPVGKQLLIASIVQRRRDELALFHQSSRRPGFAAQLTSTFRELRAWRITPDDLRRAAKALGSPGEPVLEEVASGEPALKAPAVDEAALKEGAAGFPAAEPRSLLAAKLHDLALVYSDFIESLNNRFTDPDEALDEAAEWIPRSPFLEEAEVWVDGFASFTGQELHVLRTLWRKVRSMTIALCLDPAVLDKPWTDTDLFAPTLATYHRLANMAREDGVPVEPPIILAPDPLPRFAAAPLLARLEARLYPASASAKPPSGPGSPGSNGQSTAPAEEQLVLVAAADPAVEVRAAAREIVRLCREKGWRFRDISVILRDLEPYHDLIRTVFAEHGIPYFVDELRTLSHHPLVELVRSALEAYVTNGGKEAVLRCLRTDLIPVSRDAVDRWDNELARRGVAHVPWRDLSDEELAVAGPLVRCWQKLAQAQGVRDVVTALVGLLEDIDAAGTLAQWAQEAEGAGRVEEAREHEGAWEGVIHVLEHMDASLGDESLPPAACLPLLEAGLEALRLGVIPPTLDQVLVGSALRSRQPDIRAAFVLGASERSFPKPPAEDTIFSDQERERLAPAMELGPTARARLLHEQYLTYITLTRSSHYLWISWPTADGEGKALAPSSVITRLRRMFPHVPVQVEPAEPMGDEAVLARIHRVDQLVGQVARAMRRAKEGYPVSPLWTALYERARRPGPWQDAALPVFAALDDDNDPGRLSPELAAALYGVPLWVSASRLESFAACPFQHFARYGLGLEEPEEPEPDRAHTGSFLHAALRRLMEGLWEDGVSLAALDEDAVVQRADEAAAEVAPEFYPDADRSGREGFSLDMLRDTVRRVARRLAVHARRSRFEPVAVELPFGFGGRHKGAVRAAAGQGDDAGLGAALKGGLAPLALPLAGGSVAFVRGQIDRVDVARDEQGRPWVRLIDYKSRAQKFSPAELVDGLALQLPLYMAALMADSDGLRTLTGPGASPLPAGFFHFPIRDTWERLPHPPAEDAAPNDRALKMQGLLMDDIGVAHMMDTELETSGGRSPLIPVGITKAGAFYSGSPVAGPDRWQALLRFARQRAARLADDMLAGRIDIAPYWVSRRTPCRFCPYRSVCRFDPAFPGNGYRRLGGRRDDESWAIVEAGENEAEKRMDEGARDGRDSLWP